MTVLVARVRRALSGAGSAACSPPSNGLALASDSAPVCRPCCSRSQATAQCARPTTAERPSRLRHGDRELAATDASLVLMYHSVASCDATTRTGSPSRPTGSTGSCAGCAGAACAA